MESFFSDQSPEASQRVVNYSSSSYGGFLFRSPNSPPPSPSPSPSPSIDSLSRLFLGGRPGIVGFRAGPQPCGFSLPYFSTGGAPAINLPFRPPPLLPLPRSSTLPPPVEAATETTVATAFRSRRKRPMSKAKSSAGSRKEDPVKKNEEGKPAAVAIDLSSPGRTFMVKERCNSAAGVVNDDDLAGEEVYSLSPPPSSLPFPKFSLTKQKAAGSGIAASS